MSQPREARFGGPERAFETLAKACKIGGASVPSVALGNAGDGGDSCGAVQHDRGLCCKVRLFGDVSA